jgi:hypothetical protein
MEVSPLFLVEIAQQYPKSMHRRAEQSMARRISEVKMTPAGDGMCRRYDVDRGGKINQVERISRTIRTVIKTRST